MRPEIAGHFRQEIANAARTAVAALISLLAVRLLHMPEGYWAVITTIVVMQSSFGAALRVSAQRFVGTAIGAVAGALLAMYFGANAWAFAAGIFMLGILCAILRLPRPAYRFAGIAAAIVMLVTRSQSPWSIALHRFIEVSAGIVVALAFTAIWPEPEEAS